MKLSRLALVLLFAAGACGDNSPDAPDAAPVEPDAGPFGAVSLAQLPDALEVAVCGFEVRCGLMPDASSCHAAFDPATTDVAQLAALVESNRLTYDADAAGDCLTSYRDAACDWVDGGIGPAAVCDAVFVGDKAPGVACLVDEECAGSGFCEVQACADGCCPGVCRARPDAVDVGGDCSGAPCDDGLYCRLDAAGTATCAALGAPGGVCTAIDGCESGSVCDLDPATGQGTCVHLAAAGAACDPDVAIGSCAGIDQVCDAATSTCQPRKKDGSCTSSADCIEAAACVSGACRVRPGLDEPCGLAATGGDCLGDLECTANLCTAPVAEEVCP
jgi:hypothetical protein